MRCPGCYKARVLHLKEAGDKPSTTDSTSRGMRLDVSRLDLRFAHGRSKLQGMRVDRFTQHQFLCVESLSCRCVLEATAPTYRTTFTTGTMGVTSTHWLCLRRRLASSRWLRGVVVYSDIPKNSTSTCLQWGMSPPHPSINMVRRVSALGHSLALAPIATMIKPWLSYTRFATMSKGGHYIGYSSRTTHDRPKYCEIAGCSVQVLYLYDGKMASLGRDVPDIGVRNIRPHQQCEGAVAPPDRRYVLVLTVSMFPRHVWCVIGDPYMPPLPRVAPPRDQRFAPAVPLLGHMASNRPPTPPPPPPPPSPPLPAAMEVEAGGAAAARS